MNRLTRLLLRHSSESYVLRLHHPRRPPPTTKTLNPTLPGTQNRPFSSENAEATDPFAPLKCYTRRETQTPYYVMERPTPTGEVAAAHRVMVGKGAPGGETAVPEFVEQLECGSSGVYLVGVRRDEKFAEEVKSIINNLKPEVVFLELCASRRLCLVMENLQGSKALQAQYRVFRVAFEQAIHDGSKVILGDRPFDITVRRILESMLAMRIFEFTRLSFYLLFRFTEYGKENKVFNIKFFIRQKLEELKAFPTLLQPALHERDLYMSSVLAEIAKGHSSVVALVGSDHVAGIKKHLEQNIATETDNQGNDC